MQVGSVNKVAVIYFNRSSIFLPSEIQLPLGPLGQARLENDSVWQNELGGL